MPIPAPGPTNPRTYGTLAVDVAEGVVTCTIDRPERLNGLTREVFDDFARLLDRLAEDPSARVLVIKGAGDVFSVGLDRDELDRAFADHAYFQSLLLDIETLCVSIERLDMPVIAQVDGFARAGAFEVALACDFLFMSSEARVGDVHTSFGVVSGAGMALRLARAIGLQHAKDIVFSARWVDAKEACATGLALQAVPRERFDETVNSFARQLASSSSQALRAAKRQFASIDAENIARASKIDRDILLELLELPNSDAHEGFEAYREGRQPRWGMTAFS